MEKPINIKVDEELEIIISGLSIKEIRDFIPKVIYYFEKCFDRDREIILIKRSD